MLWSQSSRYGAAALAVFGGLGFQSQGLAQDCQIRLRSDPAKAELAKALEKTNPCVLVPGLKAQALHEVWQAFLKHGKTGGKRFDDPPRGAPSGTVLVQAQGLTFDLRDKFTEGLVSLSVFSGVTRVAHISKPSPTVVIPAQKFEAGAVYKWQLLTEKNDYWGRIKVLDAEGQALLAQRLSALEQADVSPEIKKVYTAAIYEDADLIHDRDRLLGELGGDK
jgi:hypothetical protein